MTLSEAAMIMFKNEREGAETTAFTLASVILSVVIRGIASQATIIIVNHDPWHDIQGCVPTTIT